MSRDRQPYEPYFLQLGGIFKKANWNLNYGNTSGATSQDLENSLRSSLSPICQPLRVPEKKTCEISSLCRVAIRLIQAIVVAWQAFFLINIDHEIAIFISIPVLLKTHRMPY